MSTELLVGIDIGTSTTAIAVWDVRHKQPRMLGDGGKDALIPSKILGSGGRRLFGSRALQQAEEEPSLQKKLVSGFKIHFWDTPDGHAPQKDSEDAMTQFLRYILGLLTDEYGERLNKARFCLTFPAQRDALHPRFRKLVLASGFPAKRVELLDECSAAVLGLGVVPRRGGHPALDFLSKLKDVWAQLRKNQDLTGQGLLVDIGAGTTDTAVASVRSAGAIIHATGSTPVAGDACTHALANLAVPYGRGGKGTPAERWSRLVSAEVLEAERAKLELCRPYRKQAYAAYPHEVPAARYQLKLACEELGDLVSSSEEVWNRIHKSMMATWKDAKQKGKPQWVMLVGGGAEHPAIRTLAGHSFNGALRVPSDARTLTAVGAAAYLARHVAGKDKPQPAGRVVHAIPDNIRVVFPKDAGGKKVQLFSKGDSVDIGGGPVEKMKSTKLESNFFSKEGKVYLEVGVFQYNMGELDIDWDLFGESNNHPATVNATLVPGTRMLTVNVKTKNVGMHEKVHAKIVVQLKLRGGYHRV